ncbi:EAL domain-containing protein [Psychromonas sp. RZ22]|uniref:EAL domain-containing protein n=1 Tax=Psychromonas algarum TaxID=2555643 RepID=UPI001067486B|nr:EAL domain-containing protein [Psychromonas sp. RZ22]TEW54870.1 EAL domain-containing protein [Psychromonas sp. RZ22]
MLENSEYKRQALKNGRPTIAVLVGAMTSEYQEGIMRGAAYVAEENDYNIIGFCGGAINSQDSLTLLRDKVFDLVDTNLIAGVISPFSSHMRFLDEQASQTFIDRFSSVPVINIGSYIEQHTNILTDYESGFYELFSHLHHVHGYRNIMLMRGPEYHASSQKRFALYKKLLDEYDLPFDHDMVIQSNLTRESAKSRIEKFFDKSNKPVDVIITVNDKQALGIIDACVSRGIKVPQDIAVIGSMDTLEGAFSTPSLTGIKEPLFELGRTAAIELIAQIEGKKALSEIHNPTSLIVRQSCGCESSMHLQDCKASNQVSSVSLNLSDDPIYDETEGYFKRLVEQYKGGIACNEVASLLSLYQKSMQKNHFDELLTLLQQKLEKALKTEDIMLWLALTSKLQLSTLAYLDNSKNRSKKSLVKFITQLISLKNEFEQIAIKFQRFETEYYMNYFRSVVNNLNSSFDLSTIKEYTIDVLQLSEFYISVFDDVNTDKQSAKNILSVHHNELINIENKSFDAKKLLPDGIETFKDRYTLLVLPLSHRDKRIGFMTLNLSNCKAIAFENLRAVISSALKNEILIQDLKKAEKRFSDIAHSTSNWLWETNLHHQFTYCSISSEDIIGYSPHILMNKTVSELDVGKGEGYIKRILAQKDLTNIECWFRHKNGHVVCLLLSAKAIISEGVFYGYRGVFEDITEQKRQADKIKNLAYSDMLTGLPNRTLFQDTLEETIKESALKKKKFALMFIDLDHFKYINDSLGHAAGDKLLIEIAKRLNNSIRSGDVLARLGGDEFVIILPDVLDTANIIDIAERIFNDLKKPVMLKGKPVLSTLSLGISLYPTDATDAQSLLQKGDNAMYQAKSQGRNNYVFYDKLLEQKHNLRNLNEDILRDALANDGFVLHYQPQVSTETGDVIGFEALVRIQNDKQGIVAPNHFIPLAEELGLIGQIDEWVFKEGCSQYAIWRDLGLTNIRLSINLSAVQLRNDAVLATYIEILERYNVQPSDIQLEITENSLIENERIALKVLQGFRDFGVSIALDDFGTGYSSLNCINLYPIDTIKIDRSFVKDAVDNPKNKAIIQGMVLIARSLNLNVIAEGVETLEQYHFIKGLGCHEIQGYYFYKPSPAKDVQQFLVGPL